MRFGTEGTKPVGRAHKSLFGIFRSTDLFSHSARDGGAMLVLLMALRFAFPALHSQPRGWLSQRFSEDAL